MFIVGSFPQNVDCETVYDVVVQARASFVTQLSVLRFVAVAAFSENREKDKAAVDSMYAPRQWETALQCNATSHWLGTDTE